MNDDKITMGRVQVTRHDDSTLHIYIHGRHRLSILDDGSSREPTLVFETDRGYGTDALALSMGAYAMPDEVWVDAVTLHTHIEDALYS